MKANSTKRKIFDAVDLLTEDTSSQMPVKTMKGGVTNELHISKGNRPLLRKQSHPLHETCHQEAHRHESSGDC